MLPGTQFQLIAKNLLLLFLSVTFTLAGIAKLFSPIDLGISLRYTLDLPIEASLLIALTVPPLEVLTGCNEPRKSRQFLCCCC
jgi:hypothetical protein